MLRCECSLHFYAINVWSNLGSLRRRNSSVSELNKEWNRDIYVDQIFSISTNQQLLVSLKRKLITGKITWDNIFLNSMFLKHLAQLSKCNNTDWNHVYKLPLHISVIVYYVWVCGGGVQVLVRAHACAHVYDRKRNEREIESFCMWLLRIKVRKSYHFCLPSANVDAELRASCWQINSKNLLIIG